MADEPWVRRVLRDLSEHEKRRGRFEILATLGEGATATVYRARDAELGRDVALKVLKSAKLTEIARERFRREARAAAGLSHPNVVTIYAADGEADPPWIAMELVEGKPLSEIAPRERPPLIEKAARGVAAAHARGIVHRDLKPANILVAGAEAKVGDFGLAHVLDTRSELTRTGTALGTPLYMAPEQVEARADAISPRTDVYALGAMLYEALVGHPPHAADSLAELYRRIVRDDPAPPPGDAGRVVLKALDKDPARRYADAGEFADDLRRLLAGEPVLARPLGATARFVRRHRRPLLLGTLAAAAFAAAGAAIWSLRQEVERLKPDPRPWRPVFDGTSTACFMGRIEPDWRIEGKALVNTTPQPMAIQTQRTFGDVDVRVRFRPEGHTFLGFNIRITAEGGVAAEFNRGAIERMQGVDHELIFRGRGDDVSATLDGKPLPLRAHGRRAPEGTLHISLVGGTLRIMAIDTR